MPFVFSPDSAASRPDIARGPVPLAEWDLWVDSGEPVVMVADAPDAAIKANPGLLYNWLRGKASEWFGGSAAFAPSPALNWDGNVVVVTGRLASTRKR